MPPHTREGDGLTVFQEYRGFILDGGGHDWGGGNPHPGGHRRLSAAFKEVLVACDAMADVLDMPTFPELVNIMNSTSKVLSHADYGCGARLYYVFDKMDLPRSIPQDDDECTAILRGGRNTTLKGFALLVLGDRGEGAFDVHGVNSTSGYGSIVFVGSVADMLRIFTDLTPNQCLVSFTVHELAHGFTGEKRKPFDPEGHVRDQDGDEVDDTITDALYVLFPSFTLASLSRVRFSDVVRSYLDFTLKN
jgi:hypothetical protein